MILSLRHARVGTVGQAPYSDRVAVHPPGETGVRRRWGARLEDSVVAREARLETGVGMDSLACCRPIKRRILEALEPGGHGAGCVLGL